MHAQGSSAGHRMSGSTTRGDYSKHLGTFPPSQSPHQPPSVALSQTILQAMSHLHGLAYRGEALCPCTSTLHSSTLTSSTLTTQTPRDVPPRPTGTPPGSFGSTCPPGFREQGLQRKSAALFGQHACFILPTRWLTFFKFGIKCHIERCENCKCHPKASTFLVSLEKKICGRKPQN